jgi:alkanesulfonate monooxygenase SsuD/methylene tetrahydromethanopterin reductase-like flavin-dependent oxidoreductase (luciferase family)
MSRSISRLPPVETPYEATHYQLLRLLNSPNTLQHPHPPILITSSGEHKTLRLVAATAIRAICSTFPAPASPTI